MAFAILLMKALVVLSGIALWPYCGGRCQAQPAIIAQVSDAEDTETTELAKSFYSELVIGKVDRSKLSPELSQALSESMLRTISGQLEALGPPTWQYLRHINAGIANLSVYKLVFKDAILYLTFAANSNGIIYQALLSPFLPLNGS
jgi:hypothetical protein